jgi:predicted nucleotidyltransferase
MWQSERWASEDQLAVALAEVVQKCEEFEVGLLLIGAFAVRAYSQRRRLTTDLDFVALDLDRNNLAALFKSLGYDFSPQTRFGGMRATRYVGEAKVQLDVDINEVRDESSGSVYVIPKETFESRVRAEVEPLAGGTAVTAYAVPPADLLILKLMAGREQDAADAIALVLEALSDAVLADFKRKAQQAGLAERINTRLAQLVQLDDRSTRALMAGHQGERLTARELRALRSTLRRLRI